MCRPLSYTFKINNTQFSLITIGLPRTCLTLPSGILLSYKKDKDKRNGKGRRVCLGERMYSIPCRARCFASDEFILFVQIMHPGAIHRIVKNRPIGLTANTAKNLIHPPPQPKATTFAFSSVFILLLCLLYSLSDRKSFLMSPMASFCSLLNRTKTSFSFRNCCLKSSLSAYSGSSQ